MRNFNMNAKYQVSVIESERGWGQKVDEVRYFDTLKLAEQFIEDYNAGNNSPVTPEWYMYARLDGLVDLDATKKAV